MKQFLISILLMFFFKFDLAGQFSIWISGGLNLSNLDSRQFRHRFDGYHFVIHPHIGIPIEYRVNSLIFKSGIALSQRGAKFQPGTFIFPG